jgi:hypothetical protein
VIDRAPVGGWRPHQDLEQKNAGGLQRFISWAACPRPLESAAGPAGLRRDIVRLAADVQAQQQKEFV